MKQVTNIITLLIVTMLFSACDDKLEILDPNNQTTDSYWKSESDVIAGVNSIYTSFITDGTYMRMYPALTDGRGDDFKGDSPWGDLVNVANFTILPTSGPVRWIWEAHYQAVFRANQVFDNIDNIEFEDSNLKNRLLGQAHFLRGLAFFNLANTYDIIPIPLHAATSTEDRYATASRDSIWDQIYADFAEAEKLLPIDYASVSGADAGQIGRATKGAAIGMLGKAYMYRGEWSKAITQFEKIVGVADYGYGLMDDYRDNFKPFNENNKESLFEIQFADPNQVGGTIGNYGGTPTSEWKQVCSIGHTYAMEGRGYSDFLPTHWIFEEFKKELTVDGNYDPRLFHTVAFYEQGVSETAYGEKWWNPEDRIYPTKYTHNGIAGYVNENNGVENSGINYRILRYADVLLLYAEALNEVGSTSLAYTYIQQVRDRANLPDLSTAMPNMNQDAMRDQISHERALELAIESQRIHDLIRWGWFYNPDKLAELQAHDGDFLTYREGHEYLPIPQEEIDANPNIKKNSAN